MRNIFVTGIGTDIGKTIVSAILVEKLKADYWKPVQSGDLDHTDTMKVKALVSNPDSVFHPEAYRLSKPLSPHHAAKLDDISIAKDKILMPEHQNDTLIIEGAGGLMVPLNTNYLIIDLARDLGAEIVLVSKAYLGSINHTLLSIEAIQQRKLPLLGIIFNGHSNPESEQVILAYSGVRCIGRIPEAEIPGREFIRNCTALIEI